MTFKRGDIVSHTSEQCILILLVTHSTDDYDDYFGGTVLASSIDGFVVGYFSNVWTIKYYRKIDLKVKLVK